MKPNYYLLLLTTLLTLLLSACDSENNNTETTVNVEISNAYIRAMPPSAPSSAAFMTIHNTGEKDLKLIEVLSKVAKAVEIHEHQHVNGMMKMRPVASVLIPATSQLEFKPGGYHIMLIGLRSNLEINDEVEFTLKFDNNSTRTITMIVKKM